MTILQFNQAMFRHELLGKLLPLELTRTYPRLTLEGGMLCASFVGYRILPEKNVVTAFPPAYYLKITYPQCLLRSFEVLPVKAEDKSGHLMMPRAREEIKRLAELCNEVLKSFDEKADGLEQTIREYNTLLETILEPEQLAVLAQFAH